jgi:hypothetical protein
VDQKQRDQEILMAEAFANRIKNASLGEFVEYLTALAMCMRRAIVDQQIPEPDIAGVVREFAAGIGKGLPETLDGDDADERRTAHERFTRFMDALKPMAIAELVAEMANAYRDILLYDDPTRLIRLHRTMDGDIALGSNPVVRQLVALDRENSLEFDPVDGDIAAIMSDCAAAAT